MSDEYVKITDRLYFAANGDVYKLTPAGWRLEPHLFGFRPLESSTGGENG